MSLLQDVEVARRERYVGDINLLNDLITLVDEAIVFFCSSANHSEDYMPWYALNSNGFSSEFRKSSDPIRKLLFKHLIDEGISIRVASTSNGYFFEFLPPAIPDIYKNGVSMFVPSTNNLL